MRIWSGLLRCALLTGTLISGIGEFAVLQQWRLREWLPRLQR